MWHGLSHLLPEPSTHLHPRRRGLVSRIRCPNLWIYSATFRCMYDFCMTCLNINLFDYNIWNLFIIKYTITTDYVDERRPCHCDTIVTWSLAWMMQSLFCCSEISKTPEFQVILIITCVIGTCTWFDLYTMCDTVSGIAQVAVMTPVRLYWPERSLRRARRKLRWLLPAPPARGTGARWVLTQCCHTVSLT